MRPYFIIFLFAAAVPLCEPLALPTVARATDSAFLGLLTGGPRLIGCATRQAVRSRRARHGGIRACSENSLQAEAIESVNKRSTQPAYRQRGVPSSKPVFEDDEDVETILQRLQDAKSVGTREFHVQQLCTMAPRGNK